MKAAKVEEMKRLSKEELEELIADAISVWAMGSVKDLLNGLEGETEEQQFVKDHFDLIQDLSENLEGILLEVLSK